MAHSCRRRAPQTQTPPVGGNGATSRSPTRTEEFNITVCGGKSASTLVRMFLSTLQERQMKWSPSGLLWWHRRLPSVGPDVCQETHACTFVFSIPTSRFPTSFIRVKLRTLHSLRHQSGPDARKLKIILFNIQNALNVFQGIFTPKKLFVLKNKGC